MNLRQTQKNRLLFRVPVFLFDRVLFSVEADQFSELHRLKPKSTLSSLIFCAAKCSFQNLKTQPFVSSLAHWLSLAHFLRFVVNSRAVG